MKKDKKEKWWSRLGSNQRPPQCHCGALPTELRPHQKERIVWIHFKASNAF